MIENNTFRIAMSICVLLFAGIIINSIVQNIDVIVLLIHKIIKSRIIKY